MIFGTKRKVTALACCQASASTPLGKLSTLSDFNTLLSPGGGFQGGAIIASGTLLLFLADPNKKSGKSAISIVESISGLVYVGIGIAGLIIFGDNGFLDNRILPTGSFGSILSAGAIPIIYSLIGLKVGAELSAVLYKLKDAQEES